MGVISYSHGNNSWFGIFLQAFRIVALFGWGEAALGGSGGIFVMNICFSTSQRLKKICKEWQRRFSIKTLAHLHGLLYIDSYIYGCNRGALIKNPKGEGGGGRGRGKKK